MNREVRLLCVWLTAAMVAALSGCARKPAYSEMEPNKAATNQNQNRNQASETQPTAPPPAAETPPTAPPPPPTPTKSPSFLDPKGEIKDLPNYPRSYRVSAQIGPLQGMNTMSMALKTSDGMDKIVAFYEQIIKTNKWTVTDKIRDPELSEWNLKKGETDSGRVQVKKDQRTSEFNIIIVRAEKLPEPPK